MTFRKKKKKGLGRRDGKGGRRAYGAFEPCGTETFDLATQWEKRCPAVVCLEGKGSAYRKTSRLRWSADGRSGDKKGVMASRAFVCAIEEEEEKKILQTAGMFPRQKDVLPLLPEKRRPPLHLWRLRTGEKKLPPPLEVSRARRSAPFLRRNNCYQNSEYRTTREEKDQDCGNCAGAF